jgi:hypothetical protein
MRRLTAAVVLGALALAPAACKRSAKHELPEAALELRSVVPVDGPDADLQLVRGFHSLEGNPWRWTEGKFSVILRPPPGSTLEGAQLELKLNIPDVVFQQLGSVTLSATAGGILLAPEKYTAAGTYVYTRSVPASVLAGDSVSIEFATDKAIPAGKIEKRELALIVTSVGLVSISK